MNLEHRAALGAKGWSYSEATFDEYEHYYKWHEPTDKFPVRLALVLVDGRWYWGRDICSFGMSDTTPFEDPVSCLLHAELCGWEVSNGR